MAKKDMDTLTKYLDGIFAEEEALSKENHCALYGYLHAHYDLGLITLGEFERLYARLDLTTEDIDDLLL